MQNTQSLFTLWWSAEHACETPQKSHQAEGVKKHIDFGICPKVAARIATAACGNIK